MPRITDNFVWTELAHGDDYILNEQSYACLFANGNEDSLRPKDVWLDLGAHIGSFALPASRRVKRVVAVEPAPENIKHLKENVLLNWANNVTVVEAAAGPGFEDEVELGLGRTFTYTHKVGHIRGRKHIQVPAININDLVDIFQVNKIKMDVEGLEDQILRVLDYDKIEEIILEWHFTLIPDPTWELLRNTLFHLKESGFEILQAPADMTKPTKRWTAIIWVKRP